MEQDHEGCVRQVVRLYIAKRLADGASESEIASELAAMQDAATLCAVSGATLGRA